MKKGLILIATLLMVACSATKKTTYTTTITKDSSVVSLKDSVAVLKDNTVVIKADDSSYTKTTVVDFFIDSSRKSEPIVSIPKRITITEKGRKLSASSINTQKVDSSKASSVVKTEVKNKQEVKARDVHKTKPNWLLFVCIALAIIVFKKWKEWFN